MNQAPVLIYETTFAGCCATRLGTRLCSCELLLPDIVPSDSARTCQKSKKEFAGYYGPHQAKNKKFVASVAVATHLRSLLLPCPAVAIASLETSELPYRRGSRFALPIPYSLLRVWHPDRPNDKRPRGDDVRQKKFGDIAGSSSPETTCVPISL